jgi:hypothetical protein
VKYLLAKKGIEEGEKKFATYSNLGGQKELFWFSDKHLYPSSCFRSSGNPL